MIGPDADCYLAKVSYQSDRIREQLPIPADHMVVLYQGGLRVYTTLDPALQEGAERALLRGLEAVDKRHPRKSPAQGAALALDVQSGAVRAQVGGRDWRESPFDRALQSRRQPGSGYKFFTYLAALEQGRSQATLVSDAPARFRGARAGRPWRPQNYDGTFEGEMTLRRALARSRNLPAILLMQDLGQKRVEATAQRLGLAGPFGEGLAAALGVGGTSLLEMVRAYAALPAGGQLPEPHWIRAVYGPDGRNLWPRPAAPRRALPPATAYVMADMLRAVVEEGTGRQARALPFPVAGKTGTTDDQRDAWFVGFSSRLAAGVWVGRDDNTPLGWGETGAQAALPVWVDVLLASAAGGPPPPWPVPPGIEFVDIDLRSGLRSGPNCGEAAYAAFTRGSAPPRHCDREAFTLGSLAARLTLAPPGTGGARARWWEGWPR
jgi:penicillin-binding protein 1A